MSHSLPDNNSLFFFLIRPAFFVCRLHPLTERRGRLHFCLVVIHSAPITEAAAPVDHDSKHKAANHETLPLLTTPLTASPLGPKKHIPAPVNLYIVYRVPNRSIDIYIYKYLYIYINRGPPSFNLSISSVSSTTAQISLLVCVCVCVCVCPSPISLQYTYVLLSLQESAFAIIQCH